MRRGLLRFAVERLRQPGTAIFAGILLAAAGYGISSAQVAPPDTIYYDANIETMSPGQPPQQALAIKGTRIVAVGTTAEVLALAGPNTQVIDLKGATILPGFIDSHSHFLGYAFLDDPVHWIDVSSVNIYFKPLPGTTAECPSTNPNPQKCFVPVQTEDGVLARIQAALDSAPLPEPPATPPPILAANYDPARLGHSRDCAQDGFGFHCPNLEDGTARDTLDLLKYKDPSNPNPILVTSESGHIAYVNSRALKMLDICGTRFADKKCTTPTTNPFVEEHLANLGQLDEDLSFYSIGFFEGKLIKEDPTAFEKAIKNAISIYQQHGFTLIQEGAAAAFQIDIYKLLTHDKNFPFTAAMLVYEPAVADFSQVVAEAVQAKAEAAGNPNLIIAATKSFADGSTQGYTGFLSKPYSEYSFPFTDRTIFAWPYVGLPDLVKADIASRAVVSHQAGFPIVIHQNGDQAIDRSVDGLKDAQGISSSPNLRDVILHAQMATPGDLQETAKLNDAVSFLMGDLYYWGLPMCQQVLGPKRAAMLYPAADAENAGLHVTLHTDSPVIPPDPLFTIWIAKTRATQQMPWYPATNPLCAGTTLGTNEAITIAQGVAGFTTQAAWQYGLENQLGTIAPGFTANLVFLSADPLSMESNPEGLKSIRVLATVHRGQHFPNPNANQTPLWPG